jgi:hypothetical protein
MVPPTSGPRAIAVAGARGTGPKGVAMHHRQYPHTRRNGTVRAPV